MKQTLLSELKKLESMPRVDREFLRRAYERLEKGSNFLTKTERVPEHFCVFFVPVHYASHAIYLGHHIKANDWIPPGGHIEPNELPVDAVKREFAEELHFNLKDEKIELFSLSIKDVTHPEGYCARHFDLWHLVYMDEKTNYDFLKKEYYDAGWFEFTKGAEKISKNPDFKKIVLQISAYLKNA